MPIVPTWRLAALIALLAPLFLVDAGLALLADGLLLVWVAADARLCPVGSLRAERQAQRRISLGSTGDVAITLANESPRRIRVRLVDDLPPQVGRVASPRAPLPAASDFWSLDLAPRARATIHYSLDARERGATHLGDIHLRARGPLGLLWRRRRIPARDEIVIQPGLRELRRYRLLAHHDRLREMGLRAARQRGEGGSFESLREYVPGDDPRRLDWKASGRRATLIVRQMEAERSQNVLLAIDAGRLMTEEMDGEPRRERLDAALAAALLLAEVAGQHGDKVGLMVFSDGVDLFLPPTRTPLRRLAEPLAGIHAKLVEPDYPGAFNYLSRQLRRRSLIVLFTDVIDPRASSALLAHAGAATRRHLPLAVAIRNPALERAAGAEPVDEAAIYRRAAAEELLQLRSVALATMRRAGVLVADTLPVDVVPAAVNRYLQVKRGVL